MAGALASGARALPGVLQGRELGAALAQAAELLATVTGQDLEEDADGGSGDCSCLTGIAATGSAGRTYARHVQVHETNLKRLVQGEKQFRVPLWQRQYTWRIVDHRLLWRDILEQYMQSSDGGAGARSGHFPRQHRLVTGSFRRE